MQWLITFEAANDDVERLVGAGIAGLARVDGEPGRMLLTYAVPDTDDESEVVQREVDAFVNRLNGIGKVRWGRVFESVSVFSWHTVDQDGEIAETIFLEGATGHMLPRDFADFVEAMGLERPELPDGLEHIDGLDLDAALSTAGTNPAAGRAVQLVDLMLREEEFNWSAAYAAFETVEHELRERGIDGKDLGWWSKSERGDFRATANSPEVLGVRARHGKPTGLLEGRMSSVDANFLVRRVVALWLSSPYPYARDEGK